MKQSSILSVILILLSATCISAQSTVKTIESIEKRYADIAAKAKACETDDDQGEYGELFMNTLSINNRNHQWRALGIYGQTFKFFYRTVGDDEKRLYPDQLVFVKVERKESNRTYTEQYLYSDVGLLVLYSQQSENDDRSPSERRLYFSAAKPLRIIEDGKARDKLNAEDMANVKDIRSQSGKVVEIFNRSINL